MFDFEKFPVYIRTAEFITRIQPVLNNRKISLSDRNQLRRSSHSILLNIAEGAGKYSKKDKKNFYTIARGSAQECVANIQLLKLENSIDHILYNDLYEDLLVIGKMMSGLINKMAEVDVTKP